MLTREQRREIEERAWGTYNRNFAIRFCVSTGLLKPIQLARAFKMTKQRVNKILHPDGKPLSINKGAVKDDNWYIMTLGKTCEYYKPHLEKHDTSTVPYSV